MPRDYKLYLEDMIIAIDKIQDNTKGFSVSKLSENRLLFDGVLFNLQIIGEAAKHIPEAVQHKHPEVEWRKISGFRDIVAHEYFGISLEIIADILVNKLPPLRSAIKRIFEEN